MGADPGRFAYEARFAHARPRDVEPWDSLTPEVRAIWERVERASQAREHSGFSGAGIHMICGSKSDIDVVQRWCHEASTIPALRERIRSAEHFLALRTRQNTQASEAWAKAAEQALAGDPRALHNRLLLHRESAASDARVIQSESFETDFLLPESSILAAAMAARAAPDMLAVLKAVEFVGERDLEDGYVPAACPFCQGDMNFGHTAECALAAAIAKAEGR